MKRVIIAVCLIFLFTSSCTETDGETGSPLFVAVSLGDTAQDGSSAYFTIVPAGMSPDYPTNWLGGGYFTISGSSGSAPAMVIDETGSATSNIARFEDGAALDAYILIDTDGDFDPSVGAPSDGDEIGYLSIAIDALEINTITFSDTNLQTYVLVP